MAQRPIFTATVKATNTIVEVWKHGSRNVYVNYTDAITEYAPDELSNLKQKP